VYSARVNSARTTLARWPAAAALAATGLAACGLLTACSSGGRHSAAGHPAPPAAPSPSPTHVAQYLPHTSAAPSPTTTTPSSAPAAPVVDSQPQPCTTGDLGLSVGAANGAAGSIYYPLLLTNNSGRTCTLYGYPGVALVSQPGGAVVGAAAVRNPTFPAELVSLAPGAVAHASLQVAVAANYPVKVCKPATAHWLQVYPPGEYTALDIQFTAQTCTGSVGDGSTLGIFVVRPGATGP
jgi:hypothetical protein